MIELSHPNKWPGQQMSKSGNKWTITFTTDKELVDGMVIFNNGQAEYLLRSGIYVVNGRKFIVR